MNCLEIKILIKRNKRKHSNIFILFFITFFSVFYRNEVKAYGFDEDWKVIEGTLTSISVGSDGEIWGVNAKQSIDTINNVYRWNGKALESKYGYLTSISVGSKNEIWGVNATQPVDTNNVYRWNGSGWTSIPGYLTGISVNAKGEVWGINATQPVDTNNVYRWNGSDWTSIPGYLTGISVNAKGEVWGVNAKQSIDTINNVYQWNGSGWTSIPGYLTDISIGPNSQIWGVNSIQANWENNIYRRNGSGWDNIFGNLTSISAGPDSQIWGVNSQGQIFFRRSSLISGVDLEGNIHFRTGISLGNPFGLEWNNISGNLTNISVGADGEVWGVNATQPVDTNNIYRWNGSNWVNIPGYLTNISVGSINQIWGVSSTQKLGTNNIYRWNGSVWENIPGYMTNVSVGANGLVVGANYFSEESNNVYRWSGSKWINIPNSNNFTKVIVAADGKVWGLNTTGNIFYKNDVTASSDGSDWVKISGGLLNISTSPNGLIWGMNSTGRVYYISSLSGATATWTSVDTSNISEGGLVPKPSPIQASFENNSLVSIKYGTQYLNCVSEAGVWKLKSTGTSNTNPACQFKFLKTNLGYWVGLKSDSSGGNNLQSTPDSVVSFNNQNFASWEFWVLLPGTTAGSVKLFSQSTRKYLDFDASSNAIISDSGKDFILESAIIDAAKVAYDSVISTYKSTTKVGLLTLAIDKDKVTDYNTLKANIDIINKSNNTLYTGDQTIKNLNTWITNVDKLIPMQTALNALAAPTAANISTSITALDTIFKNTGYIAASAFFRS